MGDVTSSIIGRACCSQQLHCNTDDLAVSVRDLEEPVNDHRFCTVEFRAGSCEQVLFIERNAHALSVATKAMRDAAASLETIAQDAAGQERLDLATVEAALSHLGERARLQCDFQGGDEDNGR